MGRPAGSVVEVRFNGEVNGQQTRSVLHYEVVVASALNPAGPEESALLAVLTAGGTNIMLPFLGCQSPDFDLLSIDVQFIQSRRFVNVRTNFVATVGTFVGACDAQNVSAVLTKGTQFSGRSQIGSLHIPGVPKTAYVGGEVTVPYKTAMTSLAGRLVLDQLAVGGGQYNPVIYHRPKPASIGPPPTPFVPFSVDDILSVVAQNTLRTMRRRTIGVGI